MKKAQSSIFGIIGILFILIAVVLFLGVDGVDANHLGVKVRLGQIKGTMEAGVEWTGLLTQVYQYDMKIRKARVEMLGTQSATDKDGQAVFGIVNVNFRLKPDKEVVQRLYRNVGTDDVIVYRLNIEPIIKEGFKQASVQYEAIEILQNRQKVKELAKENIRKNFPAEYFEIVDIVVENIDFSDEFKNAIEQKKIATQNKLKEQEQVQVVRFQQEQEIEKYKAEAEKLKLQKSEITELLVKQQWIQKWNGQLPLYMLSSSDSQQQMLLLPNLEVDE